MFEEVNFIKMKLTVHDKTYTEIEGGLDKNSFNLHVYIETMKSEITEIQTATNENGN